MRLLLQPLVRLHGLPLGQPDVQPPERCPSSPPQPSVGPSLAQRWSGRSVTCSLTVAFPAGNLTHVFLWVSICNSSQLGASESSMCPP
ncbi:unnamed protein product [Cochlearia groenlandica]